MHIAILGPISSEHLKKVFAINKKLNLPKGHGYSIIPYLALGLIKLNCKITLISLSFDINRNKNFIINKNLNIIFCPIRKHSFKIINSEIGRGLDFFRKEIKYLSKAIKFTNPDLVNSHWTYEYSIAAIKSKIKHLITVRDISTKIIKIKFSLYRLVRLFMDFYVFTFGKNYSANSNYTKKNNIFSKKIKYIVNNCLPSYTTKKKLTPKKNKKEIIIVSSGGFGKLKNIESGILAFNRIKYKYKNLILKLVGIDLEKNGKYQKYLTSNNFDLERVIFLGKLDHIKLLSEIKQSYLLLHTSKEESFGNIYLEGMISGTPIIAGKYSGATSEVIKEYGLLVDINKVDKVANALIKYLVDKKFYNKIRIGAFNYVLKNYNYITISKKYLSIFNKIKN